MLKCPFCDADKPEFIALFGSQLLTSQYRCRACGSYFEAVRREAQELQDVSSGEAGRPVLERLWQALAEVEDPEIPVSLVDMGLIVSVAYDAPARTARLRITYTAMGCPAMDMIQHDIRRRLLREPGVDQVDIEVVWDPVWDRKRLSASARQTMRELGIAV